MWGKNTVKIFKLERNVYYGIKEVLHSQRMYTLKIGLPFDS